MSRSIHESIAGINLFVPDAHDYFSISTGGLPNGDDALIINPGNLSNPDYRAYADPPTLSPNIMKQAGSAFSMSVWLRQPVGPGVQNKGASVFKLQNSLAGDSGNAGFPLTCYVQMNMSGLFGCGLAGWKIPATGIANFPNPGNVGTSAWCFCVFRVPAPGGVVSTYFGGGTSIVNSANVVTSGTDSFTSTNRFSFGRYSDSSNNATYTGLVPAQELYKALHVGKLCFHDRLLTFAECEAMYLAMTT